MISCLRPINSNLCIVKTFDRNQMSTHPNYEFRFIINPYTYKFLQKITLEVSPIALIYFSEFTDHCYIHRLLVITQLKLRIGKQLQAGKR